jgi:peptide/nickel transport system substrate-binding protein
MKRCNVPLVSFFLVLFLAYAMPFSSACAEVTVKVAMNSADAGQLDPHMSSKTPDKCLFGWMFNGLVRFRPGSMNPATIEPDLAERWEHSPDGLTWTFYLRKGVKFHAGYGEFTAEDAVFSLERVRDPKTSKFSSDYVEFESIEALDKYTVRIKLKRIVASPLGLVANYHGGNIVSKKAVEEMGDKFKMHPIGTGPFAFKEYRTKQNVTLVGHKDYFRGAPKIDRIVYRYIPSSSSRELTFDKGETDLFYATREQKWVDRMRKRNDILVDVFEPGELRTLHMNTTVKPLNNILVRKAIAHAINREEIIQFMGKNLTRPAYSVVPNGYLGHTDNVPRYEYNPEKAKKLLKEAGYPGGLTIKAIITKVAALLSPMQIIQEQLRRVGISLDMQIVDHPTFHAQIRKDLSPLVLYGAARFPVADTYLTQFYHSRSIVGTPTAVTNFSHCKVADAQIDAARSEVDPQKQLELWKMAQQKIMSECRALPIFELLQVWGRRPNLEYGYDLNGSLSLGPLINENTNFK